MWCDGVRFVFVFCFFALVYYKLLFFGLTGLKKSRSTDILINDEKSDIVLKRVGVTTQRIWHFVANRVTGIQLSPKIVSFLWVLPF